MATGLISYHHTESKVDFGASDPSGKAAAETEAGIDMAVFKEMKELLHRLRKCASEIKQIQDTKLPELRAQLSEITGIFKGKERKAKEAE